MQTLGKNRLSVLHWGLGLSVLAHLILLIAKIPVWQQ